MGAETKDLIRIVAVTDHDTGMYHVGEVDWRYNTEVLTEHCEKYGEDELLSALAYLSHLVWTIRNERVRKEQMSGAKSASTQTPTGA